MASRRLLSAGSIVSKLSSLSIGTSRKAVPVGRIPCMGSQDSTVRFFSKDGKDSEKHNERLTDESSFLNSSKSDVDPFGVHFEDGAAGLGPEANLPPIYKRDSATGRLTGEVKEELTEEEKRILNADPIEQEKLLLNRLERQWERSDDSELNELGKRVRRSDMGLNVLGRSAQAQLEKSEDSTESSTLDEFDFSKHLTPSEFESFSAFMEKNYHLDVDEDDVPVRGGSTPKDEIEDPDSAELALKWLTARAQRQMDDTVDDNPYSDLMPGDLSPSRLVNRKRAKQIPIKLLHHNNIPLLQRYLTPTGQIRNRVQTRLGARDQRRVTKLIKRARSLGLIPYVGQMKVETHGWVHEEDIHEERAWEKELKRRGLVVKRKQTKSDSE